MMRLAYPLPTLGTMLVLVLVVARITRQQAACPSHARVERLLRHHSGGRLAMPLFPLTDP